jgi:signal transduction histidine kinase/CHASE3 domain sensor protein
MGFCGAMAAILGFGWLSYDSVLRMKESSQWVQHTYQVINQLRQIDEDLHQAQAGFRGYLVLQNPTFLQATRDGLDRMMGDTVTAVRMTSDNPIQVENFKQLMPLLNQSYALGQERIRLCTTGHLAEARAIFQQGSVIPRNAKIEDLFHQMVGEEQTLLAARQAKESVHSRDALLILFLGGAFCLFFLGAALLRVNQEIRAREELQRNIQMDEYRLFQYLEAVPLGIFVVDKNGKPYYANAQSKTLLGRGILPDVSTGTISEVYQAYRVGTQEVYPTDQLPVVRALRGEKGMTEDLEIRRPDGATLLMQNWFTPVFNMAGEVQFGMAVFNDVTERKQMEEMKHSLISIVSHQLKTPVGEINGYIENLLEGIAGPLGGRQKDYLLDMREIGLDNYRLISDLLNISKIERGLLSLNLQKIRLGETVELALRDYAKIIDRKGLTLSKDGVDPSLEVTADQDKLVETLRNLVNNAIKFTDKGGISLTAEAEGAVVRLRIKDTGLGISATSMDQLFSQKRVLGQEAGRAGAGLGLYVAKHFMKLQGGDIVATTVAGQGSTFTLIIPRA